MADNPRPFWRLTRMLALDKQEINSIYLYAVVSGLIALTLPLGIQSIINFIMAGQVSKSWILLVAVVVIGVILSGMLTLFSFTLTERIQQKIFFRSANEFAYRIPRLKLETIQNNYAPELINRFFDTINVQKSLAKVLIDAPTAILQIFFGLILLTFYHPFFVVFGVILLIGLATVFYFTFPKGLATSLEESAQKYRMAYWLEEIARVLSTFKLAGNAPILSDRTDEFATGYVKARKAHFRILVIQFINLIGFKALITGVLLLVGGFLVIDNQISIGQFVASEIIIVLIINSAEKLLFTVETIFDLLTGMEKLGHVMDIPLEAKTDEDKKDLVNEGPFHVELRKVNFEFKQDTPHLPLVDINLNILPGQLVVIVGRSGSGKSNLLHLMASQYSDYTGNFMIGGWPVKNWCKDSLRAHIGVYFNESNIFWGTVRENITLGHKVSQEKLMEIAEALGMDNYINQLSKGYETVLNPEGSTLPAHARKKILLARSLATSPKLFLAEDIFNGVDKVTQSRYLNYLLKVKKDVTMVALSHNEILAKEADQIVLMEGGRIIWNGTYEEFKVHPEHERLI
ncbi:MAG: ATP-binding cassette domain-containing protein [Schleiferiaceae bacterium]|nr:ATP-binding cassette domain-containing protein [Schleiferiaceae bacterium]